MAEGYKSFARTDQGAVRGNNEDEVYNDDEQGIYFVVDGMGGQAAGEEAARIAKEILKQRLERPTGTPDQRIREAIALANNAIFEAAERNPSWHGMACVLTVAVLEDDQAIVGHVGDSRLYKVSRTDMEKITKDHSPVGEQEDRNELNENQAMSHPKRNEVYRDVGSAPHKPYDANFVDVYPPLTVEPDSALLICSDGLTDVLPKNEILGVIRQNAGNPKKVADELIRRQKEVPGKDNVSVVYVEGPRFGRPPVRDFKAKSTPTWNRVRQRPEPAASEEEPDWRQLVVGERTEQRPLWKRYVYPVVWVVLGIGLCLAVQQLLPFFAGETPAKADPKVAEPGVIRVDTTDSSAKQTIAEAIFAAQPGNTIKLTVGQVYAESIRLKDTIWVDGGGATLRPESQIGIMVEKGGHASVSHLRIEAGTNLITGVDASEGHLVLDNIEVSGARESAMKLQGGGSLRVEHSNIHDNPGVGVLIVGPVTAHFKENTFTGNGGPDVRIDSVKSRVELAGNTFAKSAQAIWLQRGVLFQEFLRDNTFDGRRPGVTTDVKILKEGK